MANPFLFEGICKGLQEAIAYERGELEAGSVRLVRFNPDTSKCQPLSVGDFFNIACVGTGCYNILAWDPDYTKLTEEEADTLAAAEAEVARGETVPHDAINWNE